MADETNDCKSCETLTERLDRFEKRLELQEQSAQHWKKRWGIVDVELRQANGRISLLEVENKTLKTQIEKKAAQVKSLQKKLFAASSEVTPPETTEKTDEDIRGVPPKRPRGKQRGTKGSGRKIRTELPVEDTFHDIVESEKCCRECGLERKLLPFTEDSEEIHYSYKLVRIRHRRRKYRKACDCQSQPTIVTANKPDKLIPKGMYSTEFWTHVLLEKFWLQRPLSRVAMSLNLKGLGVNEGALCSGLKALTKLFAPLYNALRAQSRRSNLWQMDETHWNVYTDLAGKANHKWWLWVVETKDTTVFKLDPTRSSAVPKRHLANIEHGIVTCDRYSAYHPLLEQGILLSYCWAHVRRDFIKLQDGFPKLKKFAKKWLKRIDQLFHHAKKRQQCSDSDKEARDICWLMNKDSMRSLKRKDLHQEARAVLTSLQNHWDGLTLFLEHPALPLDNNASERALRNPVVGRKNYYGSRSIWSGSLASMMFSIFSTLAKNKADPHQFLLSYLQACAANEGKAPVEALAPFISRLLGREPVPAANMVH